MLDKNLTSTSSILSFPLEVYVGGKCACPAHICHISIPSSNIKKPNTVRILRYFKEKNTAFQDGLDRLSVLRLIGCLLPRDAVLQLEEPGCP